MAAQPSLGHWPIRNRQLLEVPLKAFSAARWLSFSIYGAVLGHSNCGRLMFHDIPLPGYGCRRAKVIVRLALTPLLTIDVQWILWVRWTLSGFAGHDALI